MRRVATRVVNIHKDSFDVYIGRRSQGYFGNPCRIGHVCDRCKNLHRDAASTLPCFESYFRERVSSDNEFRLRVLRLRDKALGCHCAPNPCHGEIIARWVDQQVMP